MDVVAAISAGSIGAVVGSFLATLAIRWVRRESVATGRSRCDVCAATLPAWTMVPIGSFLVLGGRCRWCKARIDLRHPGMELLCAVIGVISIGIDPGVGGWAGAVFGWLLAVLALLDADQLWLPDALVIPCAAAGLAVGGIGTPPELADRVIGLVAGCALLGGLARLYRTVRFRDGLGGGDVKLFGAIGAWLGWQMLPWTLLIAACLGLIWAIVLHATTGRVSASTKLPFGAALAAAAWSVWVMTAMD